ncbi:hypothetical protein NDU88_007186 [Pleurodeles waltl]|uniref:Uncharacterized protein n=1 Tax=Pleurodeles waltl TaxID=8319 RepID=A0AAV7VRS1_PLEWA|nr:hypothetical protein NDU88_007186 [Pleurodeles waltl]
MQPAVGFSGALESSRTVEGCGGAGGRDSGGHCLPCFNKDTQATKGSSPSLQHRSFWRRGSLLTAARCPRISVSEDP